MGPSHPEAADKLDGLADADMLALFVCFICENPCDVGRGGDVNK